MGFMSSMTPAPAGPFPQRDILRDMPGVNDALLEWYSAHRRDLPWRRTTDPYAILVSEVMLQQTQVARVIERYEAWLKRWPTPASPAAASAAAVLAGRVGPGYNPGAGGLGDAGA